MAPKLKTPTLPPPTTPHDRDNSPELGSPSKFTQYNKHTGRPIRKSAGVVKKVAGYVDLDDEEFEEFGPLTTEESEGDDEDDDDMDSRGRVHKKKLKRKRSPSPPSPRLEPVIYDQELEELTDNEAGGAFHRNTPEQPMTLQFNVPLGFHGPLFVKLDNDLLQKNSLGTLHQMKSGSAKKARAASPRPTRVAKPDEKRKGFTDLPPVSNVTLRIYCEDALTLYPNPKELRNNVYRYLFASNSNDIRIPPDQYCGRLARSGQFLRTCKLVHNEGCSILYGENTFLLTRHHDTRGPFWESVPKEIGYQDVLHFLKMMGPENVQYLRHIKFQFDDALPKDTPYFKSQEKRRYLTDEYLLNCLRMLRDAKLRKFQMQFLGRRYVYKTDVKFLGYLEQIKADEIDDFVEWGSYPYPPQKIHRFIFAELKELMVRKKKLYESK